MGIKERKEREKKNRRDTIIKAAKRIILKRGVEEMSMNQVADLTELNKATLYQYFENKDDLIDAVVYEGLILMEKKFEEVYQDSKTGVEKVLAHIKTIFAFYKEFPIYFLTMNHQERRKAKERLASPFSIKGNEVASNLFAKITESIKQGMNEGNIRKDIDVNILSILIFAHTYGVTHMIYSKEDVYKDLFNMDPSTIEKSAVEFLESYLK